MVTRRVLLVEDDVVSGTALTTILRRRGFQVTLVTTVAEGLARMVDRPDVLVLDLMLPDGDGGVILRQIREQNLQMRVLVTTAVNDPQRLSAIREMKPDMLLQKPIDLARLLTGIEFHN